jgi:thioredoxin 1
MNLMKGSYLTIALVVIVLSVGAFVYFTSQQQPRFQSQPAQNVQNVQNVSPTIQVAGSRYVSYTPESFTAQSDKKRVYFFHASWCPTCKAANEEIEANLSRIPEDVVLFKTDYDTNADLKQQYAVTYQHTFVYVDSAGKEIKKWNGGAIDELVKNTQ